MCFPCRKWNDNLPVSWGLYKNVFRYSYKQTAGPFFLWTFTHIYMPLVSKFNGHPFLDAVELIWASTHQHPKLESYQREKSKGGLSVQNMFVSPCRYSVSSNHPRAVCWTAGIHTSKYRRCQPSCKKHHIPHTTYTQQISGNRSEIHQLPRYPDRPDANPLASFQSSSDFSVAEVGAGTQTAQVATCL